MTEEELWEMWCALAHIYGELDSLLGTGRLEESIDEAIEAITRAQDCFYFNQPGWPMRIYLDNEG